LAGGDDWTTYAHDEQRTSTELQPTAIQKSTLSNLQLLWVYHSTAAFEASPIVVNGVVYAVDMNGKVLALDAASGTLKWSKQLDDSNETKMTPALYDGTLFVGSMQTDANDTNYSITALDPMTGNQLWSQPLPGGVHGSPVAVGGTLYVPVTLGDDGFCRTGGVYTFDEKTGSRGMSWSTDPKALGDGGGIWSSLTYYGTSIFFGSGNTCVRSTNQANAIVSMSAALTTNWAYQTAPPLEDLDVGGTVLAANGAAYGIGKNGTLYALSLQSGGLLWSRYLGAPIGAGGFSTPTIAGQTLIVGGGYVHDPDTYTGIPGGTLYGLTLGGSVKWKRSMNYADLGYAAVTNDVAFAAIDQSIAALDPGTGQTLWQYPTVGYHYASPVVAPSGLFDADESGRIYAFNIPGSTTGSIRRTSLSRSQIAGMQPSQHLAYHRPPKYCKL
jgi:outer membrane protein assembly factor BamB